MSRLRQAVDFFFPFCLGESLVLVTTIIVFETVLLCQVVLGVIWHLEIPVFPRLSGLPCH
jgi:hypothetical protein